LADHDKGSEIEGDRVVRHPDPAELMAARLVARWRERHLELRPPMTDAARCRFGSMYDVDLPSEMLAYLRDADGMVEDHTDGHDIRFWSIGEIGPAARDGELSTCFEFADYLIDSHRYGVFVSGPRAGEVVLTGGYTPIPVAEHFTQFIDRYLDAPLALFPQRGTELDEPEE
jgi:hypothetical protein